MDVSVGVYLLTKAFTVDHWTQFYPVHQLVFFGHPGYPWQLLTIVLLNNSSQSRF